MSTIPVLPTALAIAVAVIILRYTRPRDMVDYIGFTLVLWGAVLGVFSLAQQVADTAHYESECEVTE